MLWLSARRWPVLSGLAVNAAVLAALSRQTWWSSMDSGHSSVSLTGFEVVRLLVLVIVLACLTIPAVLLFGTVTRVILSAFTFVTSVLAAFLVFNLTETDFATLAVSRQSAFSVTDLARDSVISRSVGLTLIALFTLSAVSVVMMVLAPRWPQRVSVGEERRSEAVDPWKLLDQGHDPTLD